jgi:hypothetical protein
VGVDVVVVVALVVDVEGVPEVDVVGVAVVIDVVDVDFTKGPIHAVAFRS